MTSVKIPPESAAEFREELLERFDGLSKKLKEIARYVLDAPNEVALETLSVISERCGVPPSAIVRFAQTFGFSGASQMQRVLRDGLMSSTIALSYHDRVRQLGDGAKTATSEMPLLDDFAQASVLALEHLRETVSRAELAKAVGMISHASTVCVAGFRRAFPVASYLAYSLLQLGKRTLFIDGVGGLAAPQMTNLGRADLLVAISYQPYAPETIEVARKAKERGAKILAISDSPVSPIALLADAFLLVQESEMRGFRSLSASMCLAQTLAIASALEEPDDQVG
ncbi:MurR/RpiR family transcriptional regulator [Sphingobium sp.]|uniref:MurR/RpiR family transcriptional regulator n=1 Tax=Sphingobium sp. TaxID=1912891 RepID=UPI0028BD8C0C|nr:MurR/RpiR family transcriptional regulator [Sphingobium sp.]